MTETTAPSKRRRPPKPTVAKFVAGAVERSELYQTHLGDMADTLAYHARELAHHHRAYTAELARIWEAARDVGIDIDSLGRQGPVLG